MNKNSLKMTIEDAKAWVKEGRGEDAIALLREMLTGNGVDRERVLLELGAAYYALGDTTQALNQFNEVKRMNPDNTKAQAYLEMINGILDYYCKDLLNP